MEEKGLETPLIDPIDLTFVVGGVLVGAHARRSCSCRDAGRVQRSCVAKPEVHGDFGRAHGHQGSACADPYTSPRA